MTLSITLSAEAEAKLRQRAAAEGREPIEYASRLLEEAIRRSSLDDALAPLREQFAATSDSDEERIARITEARDAYRNQR